MTPSDSFMLDDPSQLQAVDYAKTLLLDPAAEAPEKQAKIALDSAIVSGVVENLQSVLRQIGQHVPQHSNELMMHAFREAARLDRYDMVRWLLEQVGSFQPQQVFEFMKYALTGAAMQQQPGMMDFLLGAMRTAFPGQLLELVQHAVNATAKRGNLVLMKFLMDHTQAAAIPVNYDEVFGWAIFDGQAETLLKGAIQGGAPYENVIMMLLSSVRNLPENNDSRLGSRQSLKHTAKVQVVKSYKSKDPELFAKLMAAIKSYFPEETAAGTATGAADGDVAM